MSGGSGEMASSGRESPESGSRGLSQVLMSQEEGYKYRDDLKNLKPETADASPVTNASSDFRSESQNSTSVVKNIHAQPFVPSMELMKALELGDQITPSREYDWRKVYTSHRVQQIEYSSNDLNDIGTSYMQPNVDCEHYKPPRYVDKMLETSHSSYAPEWDGAHLNPWIDHQQQQCNAKNILSTTKLKENMEKRAKAIMHKFQVNRNQTQNIEIPPYYMLTPLGRANESPSRFFGYPDVLYCALSARDNQAHVLRRIVNFSLHMENAFSGLNTWVKIRHPNIVGLEEAFTTRAFNDDSLVFVYAFHPLTVTLEAKTEFHISSYGCMGVPESIIWSYIVQIVLALKQIHGANLAARVINQKNILITADHRNKLCLNSCGIIDTMYHYTMVEQAQEEDLYCLGCLILYMVSGVTVTSADISKYIDMMSKSYSRQLKSLVLFLLDRRSHQKVIDNVVAIISPRIVNELRSVETYADFLENKLSDELQNDRFFGILCKLGFINERPEFEMDANWSETGDRYIIKLFRDYMFHQVDERMTPIVDMGHVIQCLNKLDLGLDERILLTSRDEKSCLIVSYKELKNCIEKSFNQLIRK